MFKALFKELWNSRVSLMGSLITTISSLIIAYSFIMDLLGLGGSSYRSLVAYGLMPFFFVVGLLMIPFGVWLQRRESRRTGLPPAPFVISFANPEHRRKTVVIALLTVVNSILLMVALYEGYHFTDSNDFCGRLCHTVMKPEYTAYQRSPHARVTCVECHIGGGASWYVKSKMSGLRQVWAVLAGNYSRPIPFPRDLRPARETCEQCHWPEMFFGMKLVSRFKPGDDGGTGNPTVTALALKLGGHNRQTKRYEGIHYHVSKDVAISYLAVDDSRRLIKRVRVTEQGKTAEFVNQSVPEPPAGTRWRTMDCVDCHNRPTHIFDDPQRAVDDALMEGRIRLRLPDIRKAAVDALTVDYASNSLAEKGIPEKLLAHYKAAGTDLTPELEKEIVEAGKVLYSIFAVNVFPEMGVRFGTYPSHIGHKTETAGCFRCHDGSHADPQGKTISQDCELCHEILAEDDSPANLPEGTRKLLVWGK